jgi:hypothetical protein
MKNNTPGSQLSNRLTATQLPLPLSLPLPPLPSLLLVPLLQPPLLMLLPLLLLWHWYRGCL